MLPGDSLPHGANAWMFLCDADGQVIRDFVEDPADAVASSARSLVARIEPTAWIDFLESARTRGSFLARELKACLDGADILLFCGGYPSGSGVLVFAAVMSFPSASSRGFTSPMSKAIHDLNNPISSIISSCDYLTEYARENLSPEQMEMIGVIECAARTLLRLSARIAELSTLRTATNSLDLP